MSVGRRHGTCVIWHRGGRRNETCVVWYLGDNDQHYQPLSTRYEMKLSIEIFLLRMKM